MKPTLRALGILTLWLATGCEDPKPAEQRLDEEAFALFGSTVFTEPTAVSMKEVHLDAGALKGKELVIEGKLVELGEHRTFAVLADDNARLLVVLTAVTDASERLRSAGQGRVRVLGRLESGKKGLPYLVVRALNVETSSGV